MIDTSAKIFTDPSDLSSLSRINRLVFTNGVFDLLHTGHVRFLEETTQYGDILVVGVNDDASTAKLKGPNRPVNPLADRMQVIAALECVMYVVPMTSTTNLKLLQLLTPTIWCKGGDYTLETLNPEERKLAEKLGIQIKILPFKHGYSTTRTLGKVAAAH